MSERGIAPKRRARFPASALTTSRLSDPPHQDERLAMPRLTARDIVRPLELTTIHGSPVRIPDSARLTHLQFRRYAGCPACNVHLRSIARRHDEVLAADIREVVVFHSKRETMLEFQGALPFAAIADHGKKLYAEFGVGKMSPLSALDPRSWRAVYRALTRSSNLRGAMGKGEEHMGLPADFLIGSDGMILAAKYGAYVDDHWSVDDLLALARARAPVGADHAPANACSPDSARQRKRRSAPAQNL
jgi:peroxiredoxin